MTSVPDPYRPENHEAELKRLYSRVKDRATGLEYAELLMVGAVFFGIVTLAITIAGAGIFAYPLGSVFKTVPVALGAWGAAWLTVVGHHLRLTLKHQAMLAIPTTVEVAPEASRSLIELSQALRSLPRDRREEFRDLWTAALEANEVLKTAPRHAPALARIQERARAAEQVVKAEEELAAAARRDAAALKTQAAIRSLEAADDHDVDRARIYAEALTEGRSKLEALTSES